MLGILNSLTIPEKGNDMRINAFDLLTVVTGALAVYINPNFNIAQTLFIGFTIMFAYAGGYLSGSGK